LTLKIPVLGQRYSVINDLLDPLGQTKRHFSCLETEFKASLWKSNQFGSLFVLLKSGAAEIKGRSARDLSNVFLFMVVL
jgi:hypothetical protein